MQWLNKWYYMCLNNPCLIPAVVQCYSTFFYLCCIITHSLNLSMISITFSISLILFQLIWFSQICHFDCHAGRTRPRLNLKFRSFECLFCWNYSWLSFNVIILASRNFHFDSQFKKLVKEKYVLMVQCKFFERQENCTSFKLVHWIFVVR